LTKKNFLLDKIAPIMYNNAPWIWKVYWRHNIGKYQVSNQTQ